MNRILQKLSEAVQAMPASLPAGIMADALVTLLFLKVVSEYWRAESTAMQATGKSRDEFDRTMRAHAPVLMHDRCLFDACRVSDPAQTGAAIRHALNLLELAQPDARLNEVLHPHRFGHLDNYLAAHHAAGSLGEVVAIIGSMNFADAVPTLAPSLALSNAFAAAMITLYCGSKRAMTEAAQLMATLLKPQPDESVFDPACEQGHLLLACATELQIRLPGAALQMTGMEAAANKLALAKMLLLLSGLPGSHLQNRDALTTTLPLQMRLHLAPADMVLTSVPETRYPWHHALARTELQSRFPQRPPVDNRLALVWHALASMKPGSGRMAVLISRNALISDEGLVLARHFLQHNLLDAVIELPGHGPLPLLLIARQQKPDTAIAYIFHGQAAPAYQVSLIASAYEAYQQRCRHPHLMQIDSSALASHPSPFDWHQVAAMVTAGELA